MKQYLLLVILCLFVTESKSQSLMTVGQVYDYSVGDLFIRNEDGTMGPPTYTTTIITDKNYSSFLDTLFYQYDLYRYTPPSCQLCEATYDTLLANTMFYTNINDVVGDDLGTEPNYLDEECIDTTGFTGTWLDDVYYDASFCNRLTTRIELMDNGPTLVDSCYMYFEPYHGHYVYGEGIGIKSYHYYSCLDISPSCIETGQLLFYMKGVDSCGVRPFIPSVSSIKEFAHRLDISIYPNPFSEQTTVIFSEAQSDIMVELFNALGKNVQSFLHSGKELIIDGNALERGLYILSITSERGRKTSKILLQ